MIRDLGIDKPVVDPTAMAPEELLAEIREMIKRLLELRGPLPEGAHAVRQGPALPRRGAGDAGARRRPVHEVTQIATYFTARYGERIAAEVGIDPREHAVDLDGMRARRASPDVERMSYRDLQARRELIRKRMEDHRRRRR